jgi:hypothetical protein
MRPYCIFVRRSISFRGLRRLYMFTQRNHPPANSKLRDLISGSVHTRQSDTRLLSSSYDHARIGRDLTAFDSQQSTAESGVRPICFEEIIKTIRYRVSTGHVDSIRWIRIQIDGPVRLYLEFVGKCTQRPDERKIPVYVYALANSAWWRYQPRSFRFALLPDSNLCRSSSSHYVRQKSRWRAFNHSFTIPL